MDPPKASTDPGWNDPPLFSYNQCLEHTKSPMKRNYLNKRVAFPMNSTSKTTTSFIDPTTTPTFNSNLPPPPLSSFGSGSNKNESISDISEKITPIEQKTNDDCDAINIDLNDVLENLNSAIEDKKETLNNQNKEEAIKKKLQVLEDSWKSDKLTEDIKKKIYEMSEALKLRDKERANQIQIGLMVDYPKVCSEFISAFRQLINVD